MGEDVGLVYNLGWFALSIVLAAIIVSIPRGHDWSTGRPSPVNKSSMANSTRGSHWICPAVQTKKGCKSYGAGSLMMS